MHNVFENLLMLDMRLKFSLNMAFLAFSHRFLHSLSVTITCLYETNLEHLMQLTNFG